MSRNVFAALDAAAAAIQEIRTLLEPFAAPGGGSQSPSPRPAQRKKPARKVASISKPTAPPAKAPKSGKGESWRRAAGLLGGQMRHMSAANQAKVKQVQKEKGIEAAIEAAKALRNG